MNMANILMSMIFGGVLERYPRIQVVLGESGIGWIPYVLHRMDAEWEDQFKDLELTMAPSDYWRRQCFATYQTDPIGIKLIDDLGADRVMWGSDFPHPDGIWPDSREYVDKELGHLPASVRRKIVCENAARLYNLPIDNPLAVASPGPRFVLNFIRWPSGPGAGGKGPAARRRPKAAGDGD